MRKVLMTIHFLTVLSFFQSMYLFVCLFIYLSIYLPTRLPHLSVLNVTYLIYTPVKSNKAGFSSGTSSLT